MNTLLLPTSIISLPSSSSWMIVGILYIAGKQPEPQPGVHNSGWARDPGDLYYKGDTAVILPVLESYVKDIPTTFKDDKRIVLWDLYNEPGGSGGYRYGERSLPLLRKIFTWGRTVNPSQPLSYRSLGYEPD